MQIRCVRLAYNSFSQRVKIVGVLCFGLIVLPSYLCLAQTTPAPPPAITPDTVPALSANAGLITNIFSDTDLKQALSDVSAQAGVAIVADSTVQGTVTADLKELPLEKALEMLLRPGGFAFAKIENYYLVGAPDPSNPNYYLFTKTEIVRLKHTTPQSIFNLLGASYGRYLSAESVTAVPFGGTSGGRIGEDSQRIPQRSATTTPPAATPQTYRIVVTAPPSMLARIRADIALLDQPQRLVMLEASVVEISTDTLKELGLDWATRWLHFDMGDDDTNLVYSKVANTEFAALNALLQNGKAHLRANPRVTTLEGLTAELEVGKESYFQILSGSVTYQYATLEKITSGILLRITPRVLEPENEVVAQVEPEVRDVTGKGANGLPEITFRRAATTLRVKDGQSIVIGGLVNESSRNIVRKTPIIGDIPLLGYLFRRVSKQSLKTEVVIIITPHILSDDLTVSNGASTPELQQLFLVPATKKNEKK